MLSYGVQRDVGDLEVITTLETETVVIVASRSKQGDRVGLSVQTHDGGHASLALTHDELRELVLALVETM